MLPRVIMLLAVLFECGGKATQASPSIELAKEPRGVPKEYVPGLRSMTPDEVNSIRDDSGKTLLHIAASLCHQVRASVLLSAGADIHARDSGGRTPLHELIDTKAPTTSNYKMAVLETLVLSGADINVRDAQGLTPLAIAVSRDDFEFAEYLSWSGAEWAPEGVPIDSQPASIARRRQNPQILTLIPDPNSRPPAAERRPFAKRSINDSLLAADLNEIIDALNDGWDVNEVKKGGRSALHRAVQQKRPELVHLLLVAGADPNPGDRHGRTPLMDAVGQAGARSDRIIANLLAAGANPSATTHSGITPLIVAAGGGCDWGILFLVGAGANPTLPTPRGSLANYASHPPTLGILRRFGVEQTASPESYLGEAPSVRMITAAKKGDLATVRECLNAGVPPDSVISQKDQRTALGWAANHKHFDIVDLLISRGADVNHHHEPTKSHLLHSLAMRQDPDDNSNQVGKDAAEIITFLISRGARVDMTTSKGNTPLMKAAEAGVTGPNTEALLNAGANLNARNNDGLSVLGVARKFGQHEMISFLKSRGASD